MHLRLRGTSIYKDFMDKIYKYGFWLLVIYVCLDISLYLTNYECMNKCVPISA